MIYLTYAACFCITFVLNLQVQYVTSDSSRSPRIASATFTYVRLSPVFNSASVCSVCSSVGPCLRGGLCGDKKSPDVFANSAPSIRVSMNGGTLIADIKNFPGIQIDPATNLLKVSSACTAADFCGVSLDPQRVG